MKIVPCLALLLLAFSLSAQAPEPALLAHRGVPGEPHHHLKIENEYVRVYYVEVPPHEDTQLHQHDHDYIYVSLGPSDVVNAVRDKPEVHLLLKDGETHFARGGFAHVARNLSDKPFRNVTIELLKTQEDARNECGEVILNQ
jgi:quercetin dioxygenase-like cupin family protein